MEHRPQLELESDRPLQSGNFYEQRRPHVADCFQPTVDQHDPVHARSAPYSFMFQTFSRLIIGGAGIVNNSSNAPNFLLPGILTMLVFNSRTAGNAVNTNIGFQAQTIFNNSSTAGSATITNNNSAPNFIRGSGSTAFNNTSTAGNAHITSADTGFVSFLGKSTAGDVGLAEAIIVRHVAHGHRIRLLRYGRAPSKVVVRRPGADGREGIIAPLRVPGGGPRLRLSRGQEGGPDRLRDDEGEEGELGRNTENPLAPIRCADETSSPRRISMRP
ncbi:hypothetical protein SAMN05444161_9188 [Rhizobiales bacterium GAS191]|nr:hypothetical protein SAMN05444161_9188 [Rhizobiales bacterium GAS191]